jgi:arylformamidase
VVCDVLLKVCDLGLTFRQRHVLLGANVIVVEGLALRDVPPGDYELFCLPLKIKDGDGAPARVVLRK